MASDNAKMKILLVEDEILIGMATAQSLEEESYSVTIITTGEKAIASVQESPSFFDLILMDIDLGDGMDGTSAAAEILKTRNIPIIFLSSHLEKEIVSKTEAITSYGYIVKHTGISVLSASIRMAFRLHNAYTEVERKTSELTAAFEELQATSEELEAANEQLIESETELTRNEKRIRSTMDSMMEGCQILSLDWRYLYVNDSAARFGKKKKDELLGKSIFECYPGIESQDIFKTLSECMTKRTFCQKEIAFDHSDGTRAFLQIEIQPVPEGLFVRSSDITEQRKTEERIVESEQRFRLLVENSPNGIFIQTDGCFSYINPTLKTMLEIMNDSDIIGKPVLDFFAPEQRDAIGEQIKKLNINHEPQPAIEAMLITITGKCIVNEIFAVPVIYNSKHGALVYAHNISERNKMENDLRNMVHLKDTLMIELQHRVKNSLGIVNSLISLESSQIKDENIKSIFNKTQSRIQTMAGVYEMLYSSPENGMDSVRLDRYVKQLSSTIIEQCCPENSFSLNFDLDKITIDHKRAVLICLILNELVINSIKHGHCEEGNSRIGIRLKNGIACHSLLVTSTALTKTPYGKEHDGGIGLSLVNVLIRELHGSISFSYEPVFSVAIEIPDNI
jgi:PAS domain S-box-containing protein